MAKSTTVTCRLRVRMPGFSDQQQPPPSDQQRRSSQVAQANWLAASGDTPKREYFLRTGVSVVSAPPL